MGVTLTEQFKERLLHMLASENPLLLNENGKNYLRYDEIIFDFMAGRTVSITFAFEGQHLANMTMSFSPDSGIFHLRGVEGRMEYQLK